MKLFVFEKAKFQFHYHDGGGVVIVAESLHRAAEMAAAAEITLLDSPWEYTVGDRDEKLFAFPDQGCC